MNKDQLHGRAKSTMGKLKEIAGGVVGNKRLENKGKLENAGGKVEAAWGDTKQGVKEDNKKLSESSD